jgi:hypothetical protein
MIKMRKIQELQADEGDVELLKELLQLSRRDAISRCTALPEWKGCEPKSKLGRKAEANVDRLLRSALNDVTSKSKMPS